MVVDVKIYLSYCHCHCHCPYQDIGIQQILAKMILLNVNDRRGCRCITIDLCSYNKSLANLLIREHDAIVIEKCIMKISI